MDIETSSAWLNQKTPSSVSDSRDNNLHLKCCLWNARSMCNKTNAIHAYLLANEISIMVITETWVKDSCFYFSNLAESKNYSFSCVNRETKGGGIGIFYLSTLKVTNVFKNATSNWSLRNEFQWCNFLSDMCLPYSWYIGERFFIWIQWYGLTVYAGVQVLLHFGWLQRTLKQTQSHCFIFDLVYRRTQFGQTQLWKYAYKWEWTWCHFEQWRKFL